MRHAMLCLSLLFAAAPVLAGDGGYTFKVENNSDQRIVKIEVSEDGDSWAPFDIDGGIAAEDTAELVWDSSTDGSDCEWMFRATFKEGYVADSDWIDFCEDDVVIQFDFDE